MRYVDVAVAILIGVSAASALIVYTPRSADGTASAELARSELRDRLTAFIEEKGFAWFMQPPSARLCSELAASSVADFELSATFGHFGCGSPPPGGVPVATESFQLPSYEVVVEAWSSAGA